MLVMMAFGNVFTQAGLITESSSAFTSLTTVSGASRFSTQFFYGTEFFKHPKCEVLDALCNILVDLDGDWAKFVKEMIAKASEDYADAGLVDRLANSENRLSALSKTDLYVQTSLAPNSCIRSAKEGIFMGPVDSNGNEIYSLPLCVQYSVSRENSLCYSTDPEGTLQLQTLVNDIVTDNLNSPRGFNDFGIFPKEIPSILIDPIKYSTKSTGLSMSAPFDSKPNVAQIAAASSAVEGVYSPLIPIIIFSQSLSVPQSSLKGLKNLAFDKLVDGFYTNSIFDNLSVCSQWPNDCGETDARFIDGYYTDQASLALNIGQYQSRMDGDMCKTLKIVLTDTNEYNYSPEGILSYFNTTFNDHVAPGDYLWPEDETYIFLAPDYFSTNPRPLYGCQ